MKQARLANYFNNLRGVQKADLKYNNYGFTVGGPIQRDKLFFFGGMEWRKIRRSTAPTFRTLPSSAYRSGDFSGLSTVLRDPANNNQPFPGNIIPANRITADGKAIAAVYAAMAKQAVSYVDTNTSNNALFQDPNPFDYRQDSIRLDYQASQSQRLSMRLLFDHYDLIEPGGTFISSQLPTVPTNRKRPGRNLQLNHFWTPRSTIVNEAKFNYSGNSQKIPPVGDTWKRETYGFQFPQLYAGGGEYENSIPNVDMTGFATFRGANGSLLSPTRDYSLSDHMTWTKRPHAEGRGAGDLQREGPERPLRVPGLRELRDGRQLDDDRQRLRRRAARQLPDLSGIPARPRCACLFSAVRTAQTMKL